MLRMSKEMQVYSALAETMRMYFYGKVGVTVKQRSTTIEFRITGIPIFASGNKEICIRIPAGQIEFNDGVRLRNGIMNSAVSMKMSDGQTFPHPHVWDGGVPCWNGKGITNLQGLFCIIINTITWRNVTIDSKMHGHFTSCRCSSKLYASSDPIRTIENHKNAISNAVGFDVRTRDPVEVYPAFTKNLSKIMG